MIPESLRSLRFLASFAVKPGFNRKARRGFAEDAKKDEFL